MMNLARLLIIIAMASAESFAADITISRMDIALLKRMGASGIPPSTGDHIQVIIRNAKAEEVKARVVFTVKGEFVEYTRRVPVADNGSGDGKRAYFIIPVERIADVRIQSGDVTELPEGEKTEAAIQ